MAKTIWFNILSECPAWTLAFEQQISILGVLTLFSTFLFLSDGGGGGKSGGALVGGKSVPG